MDASAIRCFSEGADSFISSHDDMSFLAQKHYVFDSDAPEAEESAGSVLAKEPPKHAIEMAAKQGEAAKEGKVPKQTKCARNFQFTLNEVARWDALKSYLTSVKSLQYLLAGKEKAPQTGHEHIHVYVQFSKSIRLSWSKLEGAHVEVCRGSAQENIKYIKKEDTEILLEQGAAKYKGGITIKELKEMPAADREMLSAHYFNTVQKLNAEEAADIDVDDLFKEVKVFYFFGASGAGKTVLAKKWIKEKCAGMKINMLKFEGSFWHGVGNAEVALYDDYRDSHMPASEFIHFIDYNVHAMNIKGGSHANRYKWIFITSIQDPRWIYTNAKNNDESLRQWLRRMKIIKVDENKDNPLDPVFEEVKYD